MDQIDYKNKVWSEIILWAPYTYHSYNINYNNAVYIVWLQPLVFIA